MERKESEGEYLEFKTNGNGADISKAIAQLLQGKKSIIEDFDKLDKSRLVELIIHDNPGLKPVKEVVLENKIFAFSQVFDYRLTYKEEDEGIDYMVEEKQVLMYIVKDGKVQVRLLVNNGMDGYWKFVPYRVGFFDEGEIATGGVEESRYHPVSSCMVHPKLQELLWDFEVQKKYIGRGDKDRIISEYFLLDDYELFNGFQEGRENKRNGSDYEAFVASQVYELDIETQDFFEGVFLCHYWKKEFMPHFWFLMQKALNGLGGILDIKKYAEDSGLISALRTYKGFMEQFVSRIALLEKTDFDLQPDIQFFVNMFKDINDFLSTGFVPQFCDENLIGEYSFSHQELGKVTIQIFEIEFYGEKVHWHMASSSFFREYVWIHNIRLADAEISSFGIDAVVLNAGPLVSTPFIEMTRLPYSFVYEAYKGNRHKVNEYYISIMDILGHLLPIMNYKKYLNR